MARLSPVVVRTLVPPAPSAAAAPPPGYTLLDTTLSQGLPARFPLSARLTLALVLPTGLARPWLRADPATVVSTSEEPPPDGASRRPGLADAARPPIRLVLVADGRRVSEVPLVRGAERLLPADPGRPAEIAVRPLGWRVTAGALVGPGTSGSWLRLAWRSVGTAPDYPPRPPRRPGEPSPAHAVGFGPSVPATATQEWR